MTRDSPATNTPQVVGFIDIGTNAIRLLVARLTPNHSHTTITQQREPARLGEGEFATRRLQPEAMDRAVLVCRKFVELSRLHGAGKIIAVATSATRDATNQEEFLRRLKQEAGLDVQVISGREEARLTYLGVASTFDLGKKEAVFIDIGGGSTEVIVGGQHDYHYLDTLTVGAVRLTTLLLSPHEGSPVSPELYQRLREHVRYKAVHTVQHVRERRVDVALGSSGTIQNLAAVAARALRGRTRETEDVLTLSDLKRVAATLCALPLEDRRAVPGLNPDRADIIIAGVAILQTLMEDLGLPEIRVAAEGGVREGLLMDYLQKTEHPRGLHGLSVRERSVLQLARACNADEAHSRNVARLALELFDSAREADLHRLGPRKRELLEYAALLHDVGSFLSYSNHHIHSFYLISNADLLGFDKAEITLTALTALFHRKGLPTMRNQAYASLERESRRSVAMLSLMIRLAESLDRSHQNVVTHARLGVSGQRAVTLEIEAEGDSQLEVWGALTRERAVEKTLGRRLRIELNGRPYPPLLTELGPKQKASGRSGQRVLMSAVSH